MTDKLGDFELNKIYCMDAKELLSKIKDNKKIVIITDPPYGINLDLKWLSEIHLADGKMPNKSDELILEDNKPFDATHLFNYKRRLIFGFPYIYDKDAYCHMECSFSYWDEKQKRLKEAWEKARAIYEKDKEMME